MKNSGLNFWKILGKFQKKRHQLPRYDAVQHSLRITSGSGNGAAEVENVLEFELENS